MKLSVFTLSLMGWSFVAGCGDIFADRPEPSGVQADKTTITVEE